MIACFAVGTWLLADQKNGEAQESNLVVVVQGPLYRLPHLFTLNYITLQHTISVVENLQNCPNMTGHVCLLIV
jgi:hypothetical protein